MFPFDCSGARAPAHAYDRNSSHTSLPPWDRQCQEQEEDFAFPCLPATLTFSLQKHTKTLLSHWHSLPVGGLCLEGLMIDGILCAIRSI